MISFLKEFALLKNNKMSNTEENKKLRQNFSKDYLLKK
jgi:hypothetical protein